MRKAQILLLLLLTLSFNGFAQQCGDVNGDMEINIADVNSIIGIISYGMGSSTAADVNADGEINIADVNALVDIIMGRNIPDEVDLGLPSGTLWATRNVGANSPEDYGDYFAWGETYPKPIYNWAYYKWCDGDYNKLTKYCTDIYYGTVDNLIELELDDDAARVNWGKLWHMPSHEQILELFECCAFRWAQLNGVNGQLVTGPNGNTMFLPAAGFCVDGLLRLADSYGCYWSRTLRRSGLPWSLNFYKNSCDLYFDDSSGNDVGVTVRAVRAD